MAKNVVLLVRCRSDVPTDHETGRPVRYGEVIGQFRTGHNFGRMEQPTKGKFVHVRLNDVDDDRDFTEQYETGQKRFGEPDPKTGVSAVINLTAKRWRVPAVIVDGIIATGGARRVLEEVELEDRKPVK